MTLSSAVARIRLRAAGPIARAGYLAKLLFFPIAFLALVTLVLEAGLWRHQETHEGPFAPDPFVAGDVAGHAVGFLIGGFPRLRCCMEIRSDSDRRQSDLRLWINDVEMGPPVTRLDERRVGEESGSR